MKANGTEILTSKRPSRAVKVVQNAKGWRFERVDPAGEFWHMVGQPTSMTFQWIRIPHRIDGLKVAE